MVPFEMQMDARMMLARMSVIYEREVGNKIKMSRDEDIVALINYAVESINDEVKKLYGQFVKLLTPGEVKQLAAQGANIYRGAVVPEDDSVFASDSTGEGNEPGVKMYRGVPVAGAAPSKPVQNAEPQPESTPVPGKSKRVYRGRVIED